MTFLVPEAPPIGTPVHFLNCADRRNPVAGIIQECNADGVARISIVPKSGGTVESKLSVHHVDDPHLREHPDLAARNGAWDYHPWFRPKAVNPTTEAQVVEWANEYTFATVVKKSNGLGLTKADVQFIYDKHGLEPREKGDS